MTPDAATAAFRALSTVLTAEPALAPSSVSRHLTTLQARLGAAEVEAMLEAFVAVQAAGGDAAAGVRDLLGDAQQGPRLKATLTLWFTGQAPIGAAAPAAPLNPAEDYFEALMWSTVGAHAPAFSDGYYGHWRYPPETGG